MGAKFSGVDLKTEAPETYLAGVLKPITEDDLEFPNGGEIEQLELED